MLQPLLDPTKRALEEVLRRYSEEQFDLPGCITLTHDDGRISPYEKGLPLYKKYGVKGTQFIPTDFIGTAGYLTWEQVGEFKDIGWEIGSHSRTHPDLRTVTDAELLEEVKGSKDIIKAELNVEPTSFAYPYGYWDHRVKRVVAEYYKQARATNALLLLFPFHTLSNVFIHRYTLMGHPKTITSYEGAMRYIELLKKFGGWLIDLKHGTEEYLAAEATLEKILKKAQEFGVEFVTLEEGAKRFFGRRVNVGRDMTLSMLSTLSSCNIILDDIAGWCYLSGVEDYPYVEPPAGGYKAAYYYPYIPIHPGQRVWLSTKLKADANILKSYLRIYFYNSIGEIVTTPLSSDFGGNYDWTIRSFSAVAPDSAVFIKVGIRGESVAGAKGKLYWKGVTLSMRVYPQVDSDYVLRVRTVA